MQRSYFAYGILAAGLLLLGTAAGCGDDDDDGFDCDHACEAGKPFCGPNNKCVECVFNGDCKSNEFCGEDYECHD